MLTLALDPSRQSLKKYPKWNMMILLFMFTGIHNKGRIQSKQSDSSNPLLNRGFPDKRKRHHASTHFLLPNTCTLDYIDRGEVCSYTFLIMFIKKKISDKKKASINFFKKASKV